jgi:serine/threonine-protein kinase RsbW
LASRLQGALPAVPEAAAQARSMVDRLDELAGSVREALTVIVSELVTNSVRHAGLSPQDAVTLIIEADESRVRVEVRDGGPGFDPDVVSLASASAQGGFGLPIVGTLAARWDVDPTRGVVWAELDLPARCSLSAGQARRSSAPPASRKLT